jgi:hypothetical protein
VDELIRFGWNTAFPSIWLLQGFYFTIARFETNSNLHVLTTESLVSLLCTSRQSLPMKTGPTLLTGSKLTARVVLVTIKVYDE